MNFMYIVYVTNKRLLIRIFINKHIVDVDDERSPCLWLGTSVMPIMLQSTNRYDNIRVQRMHDDQICGNGKVIMISKGY